MGLLKNVCWFQAYSRDLIAYNDGNRLHNIAHAGVGGKALLRYMPVGGWECYCPDQTYQHFNPDGSNATTGWEGTGDRSHHFDYDACMFTRCEDIWDEDPNIGYSSVVRSTGGQEREGRPTQWIVGREDSIGNAGEAYELGDSIAVYPMLATLLNNISSSPPGSTDYPPHDNFGVMPPNGWAGYPTKIKIHYRELSVAERVQYFGDSGSVNFQYAVYNMRGDVIGGSGGHIGSGVPVNLAYTMTDHGDGRMISWDLGGIKFAGDYIKFITKISLAVAGRGYNTSVSRLVVQAEPDTEITVEMNAHGGGIDCVHSHHADLISLGVNLEVTRTEII